MTSRVPVAVDGVIISKQQQEIFEKLKLKENSTEYKIQYAISQFPEHTALLLNEEYVELRAAKTRDAIAQYTTSKYWLIRQWAEEKLAVLGHYNTFPRALPMPPRFPMLAWDFVSRFRERFLP